MDVDLTHAIAIVALFGSRRMRLRTGVLLPLRQATN
jgi:hypothetical protein